MGKILRDQDILSQRAIPDATLAQNVLIPKDLSHEDEYQSVSVTVKAFGDLLLKMADIAIF
jgi:hypothetical protein